MNNILAFYITETANTYYYLIDTRRSCEYVCITVKRTTENIYAIEKHITLENQLTRFQYSGRHIQPIDPAFVIDVVLNQTIK